MYFCFHFNTDINAICAVCLGGMFFDSLYLQYTFKKMSVAVHLNILEYIFLPSRLDWSKEEKCFVEELLSSSFCRAPREFPWHSLCCWNTALGGVPSLFRGGGLMSLVAGTAMVWICLLSAPSVFLLTAHCLDPFQEVCLSIRARLRCFRDSVHLLTCVPLFFPA